MKVFPTEESRPPRFGALRPMGDVLTRATQDDLFAIQALDRTQQILPLRLGLPLTSSVS